MPYPRCKVYSDGSHYIAIPHTTRPYKPRRKPKEEVITVSEESTELQEQAENSRPRLGTRLFRLMKIIMKIEKLSRLTAVAKRRIRP